MWKRAELDEALCASFNSKQKDAVMRNIELLVMVVVVRDQSIGIAFDLRQLILNSNAEPRVH